MLIDYYPYPYGPTPSFTLVRTYTTISSNEKDRERLENIPIRNDLQLTVKPSSSKLPLKHDKNSAIYDTDVNYILPVCASVNNNYIRIVRNVLKLILSTSYGYKRKPVLIALNYAVPTETTFSQQDPSGLITSTNSSRVPNNDKSPDPPTPE